MIDELNRIIHHLDPDLRSGAQLDRDQLLAAGVDSQEALEALAQDPAAPVALRTIACWFLGRLASPGARLALEVALRAADPALRAEAARGLGTLADSQAFAALLNALQNDPSPAVRFAAAYALGLLADERMIEPLIAKLADATEDPAVRGMAAETLGNALDPRAVEPLIAALSDSAVEVRFWAAFAVGELGAEAALPELYRLAEADDTVLPGWWSVRQEAKASIDLIKSRLQTENEPENEPEDEPENNEEETQ